MAQQTTTTTAMTINAWSGLEKSRPDGPPPPAAAMVGYTSVGKPFSIQAVVPPSML